MLAQVSTTLEKGVVFVVANACRIDLHGSCPVGRSAVPWMWRSLLMRDVWYLPRTCSTTLGAAPAVLKQP